MSGNTNAPSSSKPSKGKEKSQSFSAMAWRRFKKNKVSMAGLFVLGILALVGLFHPMVVGTKPIVCYYKGQYYFPAMSYYNEAWENTVFGISGDKFRNSYPGNLKENDPESWAIWPLVYQDPYRKVDDKDWEFFTDELERKEKLTIVQASLERARLPETEPLPFQELEKEEERKLSSFDKSIYRYRKKLQRYDAAKLEKELEKLQADAPTWKYEPASYWWHRPGNSNNSPPTKYNFFGTDAFGRDVFARMVHGTAIALLVGFVSMGISSLIGLFIGSCAGYFGDDRLRLNTLGTLALGIFLFLPILDVLLWVLTSPAEVPADFIGPLATGENLATPGQAESTKFLFFFTLSFSTVFIYIALAMLAGVVGQWLGRVYGQSSPGLGRELFTLPVDLILTRLMDVVLSVPGLILILALIAILPKPTIWHTMVVIGATSWVGIARLVRGEFLKLKKAEFVLAAQALGGSDLRVIVRHLLPNSMAPVLVSISFGVAGAILVESGLSFLGFGVQPPTPSWGSILGDGFEDLSQWWLIFFPGLAIFLAVFTYNLVGDGLQEALDPRLKQG